MSTELVGNTATGIRSVSSTILYGGHSGAVDLDCGQCFRFDLSAERSDDTSVGAVWSSALLRQTGDGCLPRRDPELMQVGGDMPQRLGKAADKASEAAADVLLGQRRPTNLIAEVML